MISVIICKCDRRHKYKRKYCKRNNTDDRSGKQCLVQVLIKQSRQILVKTRNCLALLL